uniref:Uncharacterized protein n=1 Tax=Podoviridae sp. ctOAf25 TaxID=2825245 RepID=A0A8S5PPC2_9CAUD|nr:MAG TPA: hypothetical protein [Podoviridae sp. ctOAf25]
MNKYFLCQFITSLYLFVDCIVLQLNCNVNSFSVKYKKNN